VSFTMGLCGTSLCGVGPAITITNSCFHSVSDGFIWSRGVYNNIQKYIQFRVMVNVVAVVTVMIGAFFKRRFLKPIQLLWLCLISMFYFSHLLNFFSF
jgi:Ca2+-transporting ATPase